MIKNLKDSKMSCSYGFYVQEYYVSSHDKNVGNTYVIQSSDLPAIIIDYLVTKFSRPCKQSVNMLTNVVIIHWAKY